MAICRNETATAFERTVILRRIADFVPHMTLGEESFIQRRAVLETIIFECIWTVSLCYDLYPDMSSELVWLSEQRSVVTALNQQVITTWTFPTPQGPVRLNITIGHTGPNWQAFVTVTTSDGFSERFLDSGSGHPVRGPLIAQIKRINGIT
jgi:hypothetical protein